MRKKNISSDNTSSKTTLDVSPKTHNNLIGSAHKKATKREAQAASPADESIGGEEDPGGSLDLTVTRNNYSNKSLSQ